MSVGDAPVLVERIDGKLTLNGEQIEQMVRNERKRLANFRLKQVRSQSKGIALAKVSDTRDKRLEIVNGIAAELEVKFNSEKSSEIEKLERVKERVIKLRGCGQLDAQHLNICKKEIVERAKCQIQYEQGLTARRSDLALCTLQQERLARQLPLLEKSWIHGNIMRKERNKAHRWTLHYEKFPPEPPLDEILQSQTRVSANKSLLSRSKATRVGSILPFDASHCHRDYTVVKCDRNLRHESKRLCPIVSAKVAAKIETEKLSKLLEQKDIAAKEGKQRARKRFNEASYRLHMDKERRNLQADLETVHFGYRQYLEQFSGVNHSRLDKIVAPSESQKLTAFKNGFIS